MTFSGDQAPRNRKAKDMTNFPVIETSYGAKFIVKDTGEIGLDHVWFGFEIKIAKSGAWAYKAKTGKPPRKALVRKEASRVVALVQTPSDPFDN